MANTTTSTDSAHSQPPTASISAAHYVLAHPPSPPAPSSRRASFHDPQSSRTSTSSLEGQPSKAVAHETHSRDQDQDITRPEVHSPSLHTAASGTSGSSSNNSALEFLDNDISDIDDLDLDMDDLDFDDEGSDARVDEPLVRGGRRRHGRRWRQDEKKEKGLIELIPWIILSHPLPLLPLLALLPYNFLPAGVVFFIPIICALALLSVCAHIVIVYLSWYLKVPSFEDVFATVTGKYGKYGLWAGRVAIITAVLGTLVSWLETVHPLLQPVVDTYLPTNALFSSRIFWTVFASLALLPSLVPSRMTRSLRRTPVFLALLLPIVAFLVIGRTVEIKKASELPQPIVDDGGEGDGVEAMSAASEALGNLVKRRFGLAGGSSAGAGLTTLAIFFSPHINTLPIHASLARAKRGSFFMPCLFAGACILILSLPLALVPYYLLPLSTDSDSFGGADTMTTIANPTIPSGIFAHLPADDGWVNLARVLQVMLTLGSANMWILRGRDTLIKIMNVEGGERYKAGRWVGFAWWGVVVGFTCIGGWVADKVELIGVVAVLVVGWFLPSLFFIITFHVRSPLSIIFVSRQKPANASSSLPQVATSLGRVRGGHSRDDSLNDPANDELLAKKERDLQKRRLGRRLWQDMVVYLGILPVGCITLAWTLGRLVGLF